MATRKQFAEHKARWDDCTRCIIGRLATQKVFYKGCLRKPSILFVGEAPGVSEDALGEPFVPGAPAGRILNSLIKATLHTHAFSALTYGITNVVLCAPWKNIVQAAEGISYEQKTRTPTSIEQTNCSDRLVELYRMLKPKAVVYLGKVASGCSARRMFDESPYQLELLHPAYIARRGGFASVDYHRTVLLLNNFLGKLDQALESER